jgi:hypothetical protein
MALNTALKVAFIERGIRQVVVAAKLRQQGLVIDDTRLSKIVNGHLEATPEEKRALAKVLRRPVTYLFPESQEVTS